MKKEERPGFSKRKLADLAVEYSFDYSTSKPNRFGGHVATDAVAVVLDPDVATVFHDSVQVNDLLRATIRAVRKPRSKRSAS